MCQLAAGSPSSSLAQSQVLESAFKAHGSVHSFLLFSGYRLGPRSFAGLGLGALLLKERRRFGDCRWVGRAGSRAVMLGKLK
eukprot:SM010055S09548  [mRNA]  locus=s10055:87:491:+ [translate_table: standard]